MKSSLDSTESKCVVVARPLSTIRNVEQIYVLKVGKFARSFFMRKRPVHVLFQVLFHLVALCLLKTPAFLVVCSPRKLSVRRIVQTTSASRSYTLK